MQYFFISHYWPQTNKFSGLILKNACKVIQKNIFVQMLNKKKS